MMADLPQGFSWADKKSETGAPALPQGFEWNDTPLDSDLNGNTADVVMREGVARNLADSDMLILSGIARTLGPDSSVGRLSEDERLTFAASTRPKAVAALERAEADLNGLGERRYTDGYALSAEDHKRLAEGRARQRVKAAREALAMLDSIEAGVVEPPRYNKTRNRTVGAVKAALTGIASDIPKFAGGVQSIVTGQDPAETALYEFGDGTGKMIDSILWTDEGRQEELGQQVAEGIGSTAPYLVPGMQGARGLALGASQGGAGGLDDAIANEATTTQKKIALLANAGLGMTEALPMGRLLDRLDVRSGGKVTRIINEAGKTGAEEMLQEVGQTLGSNFVAEEIAAYDEERGLMEGVEDAAKVGGLVGLLLGGGAAAVTKGRRPNGPTDAELDAVIEALPADDATLPTAPSARTVALPDGFNWLDRDIELPPPTPPRVVDWTSAPDNPYRRQEVPQTETVLTRPIAPEEIDLRPAQLAAQQRAFDAREAFIEDRVEMGVEREMELRRALGEPSLDAEPDAERELRDRLRQEVEQDRGYLSDLSDHMERALKGDGEALSIWQVGRIDDMPPAQPVIVDGMRSRRVLDVADAPVQANRADPVQPQPDTARGAVSPRQRAQFQVETMTPEAESEPGTGPQWDFSTPDAEDLNRILDETRSNALPTRVRVRIEQFVTQSVARQIADREKAGERVLIGDLVAKASAAARPSTAVAELQVPDNSGRFTNIQTAIDGTALFDPRHIKVDADQFQFKTGGDSNGVIDTLQNIDEWDPSLGAGLSFWVSIDGDVFVADGHQRTGLARRLLENGKAEQIALRGDVWYESDGISARQAMAMAALKNVDNATAYDLATVFEAYPEGLESPRINKSRPTFRQARDLTELSFEARGYAKNADIPPGYAAAVGRLAKGQTDRHMDLLQFLSEEPPANQAEAEFTIRAALIGPTVDVKQEDMFGTTTRQRGLVREKREIATRARKDVVSLARQLGRAARDPSVLTEVEGNVIDAEASKKASDDAKTAAWIIDKLALQAGSPVAEALNRAAQRYAEGGSRDAAVREFVADVRRLASQPGGIRNLVEAGGRDDGQDGAGPEVDDGPDPDQSALFARILPNSPDPGPAAEPDPRRTEPTPRRTLHTGRRRRKARRTPEGEMVGVEHELAQNLAGATERLKRLLNITARQGRMGNVPEGVAGYYKFADGGIRLRRSWRAEMDVFAHEVGHALEFKTGGKHFRAFLQEHADQLAALAYSGADPLSQREEGFAEWFRRYITNPAYARNEAPDFYDAFEAYWTERKSGYLKGFKDVQDAWSRFITAPSSASIAASVVSDGGDGRLARIRKDIQDKGVAAYLSVKWSKIYTALVDSQHPMTRVVKELIRMPESRGEARIQLRAAQDPSKLLRLAIDSTSSGQMDIQHGVHPYRTSQPQGPSLADAVELAMGDGKWTKAREANFGAYLVARRAIHEWDRYLQGEVPNPPTIQTRDEHALAIEEFERENPTWRDAAGMVHGWTRNLWRKKRDAGLITEEQWLQGNLLTDYVPFMRDISDKDIAGSISSRKGNNRNAGGVQRYRGSDRDIINPIESLMKDGYETARIIARNDVLKALRRLARRAGPGAARLVEELPATEFETSQVDLINAMKSKLRQAGHPAEMIDDISRNIVSLMDDNGMATLFKATPAKERGEPIVWVWEGGKRIPLRIGDADFAQDIFTTFTQLNETQGDTFLNMAALPTTALRMGITTSPDFILTNYVRDQLSAWILTDVGYRPFVDGAKGIKADLTADDVSRLYNLAGGISGGVNVAALKDARTEGDIRALRKKGIRVRRFMSWKGFARLTEVSETGTRIGIFARYFQDAKARGMTDHDATLEAAFEARDYIDFGRHGSKMIYARRLATFMNAAIQGLDKAARVGTADGRLFSQAAPYLAHRLGKTPSRQLTVQERRAIERGAKMWAKMTAIGVMGLSLRMLYEGDEEYEEFSDYTRATHWPVRINGQWYVIPKPFELGALSNIMERGYEQMVLDDPTAAKRLREGLLFLVTPPHDVPAINLPFELWANKKKFNDAPIVPPHMKALEPHLQYTAYTSEFSRSLARALKDTPEWVPGKVESFAPAEMDHIIQALGGSWGRNLLNFYDATMPEAPARSPENTPIVRRVAKDPDNGGLSRGMMFDLVNRTDGKWTRSARTIRKLAERKRYEDVAEYLDSLDAPQREWGVVMATGTTAQKRMHPLRRGYDGQDVAGDMRKELLENGLEGGDGKVIPLSAAARRDLMEELANLQTAYARNGLILSGQPGWAQKTWRAEQPIIDRIMEISPDATRELDRRLTKARVTPEGDVVANWEALRPFIDAQLAQATSP